MTEILTAIIVMTGLSLTFAVILAVAYNFLRVEEDPRLEKVSELLPGNNCGACGEPGCNAFADLLVAGKVEPSKCTVADADTLVVIGEFLGVDVGTREAVVARLKCGGGRGRARSEGSYEGMESCRAATLVDGGGLACVWGCLGLSDCERVCTFDAIKMNERALPTVDPELCTACGDCVDVCPKDLFVLDKLEHKLFVQCNTPLAGEAALAMCTAACDGCSRCAADAPKDSVVMVGGLPVIHWDRPEKPGAEATWRCPTGAIQWIEGQQFSEEMEGEWEDEAWRRRA